MKKYLWLSFVVLLVASAVQAANDRISFENVSFLEGCWKGDARFLISNELIRMSGNALQIHNIIRRALARHRFSISIKDWLKARTFILPSEQML